MTFRGHVKNGVVVLDDAVILPNDAVVWVQLDGPGGPPAAQGDSEQSSRLRALLQRFAGKAQGLPPDSAEQHDHYLYGTPKK